MVREIIAILRGVTPYEVAGIAEELILSGITKIEVPLNSPNAYESIEILATRFSSEAMIGAGTVLAKNEVSLVWNSGGKMIVSPNVNADVIRETKKLNMRSYPGVFTATECFEAVQNGSDGLKLFPAFLMGVDGLKALRAVLPPSLSTYAVGGVDPNNFVDWLASGVTGFGIGSYLYKVGDNASAVREKADEIVSAYDDASDAST
jgi:2-dehydro-3-deoxyphosphogalactonate aldolase